MDLWRRGWDGSATDSPLVSGSSLHRASFELRDDNETEKRASFRGVPSPLGTVPESGGGMFRAQHDALSGVTDGAFRSVPACLDELEALEAWRLTELSDLLKGKRLAVFLDYDGTLTPIVSNPDEAFLSEQMREVVKQLANHFPTAIISGRGREKVQSFVKLKELFYAGSHGMDITGPKDVDGSHSWRDVTFQPASHFRPMVDEVYNELCSRLKSIPGASVEHNTFCVSAHFRNCPGDYWEQVVIQVEEVVSSRSSDLHITRGRKVLEIRPKANWNKGTALNHLLEVFGLQAKSDVVSIYIGDDRTDEDAFKALNEGKQGFGILVTTKLKETAAKYTLREPQEVMKLLTELVAWGLSEDNGWRTWSGKVQGDWVPSASISLRSSQQEGSDVQSTLRETIQSDATTWLTCSSSAGLGKEAAQQPGAGEEKETESSAKGQESESSAKCEAGSSKDVSCIADTSKDELCKAGGSKDVSCKAGGPNDVSCIADTSEDESCKASGSKDVSDASASVV
eukprot:gene8744-33604_t